MPFNSYPYFVFLAVARLPPWLVVVGFAAAMGLFHPAVRL